MKGSSKSPFSERCTGVFNMSNAWTMLNKMMVEKAGVKKQNSKKGFEKMSMPAAWRGFHTFRFHCPRLQVRF